MAADPSALEREMWTSFFVMRRQLELTLERRLQTDAGISTADYEILSTLAASTESQLRAGHIGDLIGWEKSRVSHQIARMETRGLLTRVECDADARGVWVELTDAGLDAVRAAEPHRREAVRKYIFDVLSDEEKLALTEISRKVLDAINPPICMRAGAEGEAISGLSATPAPIAVSASGTAEPA